jgi:hypothetical protein
MPYEQNFRNVEEENTEILQAPQDSTSTEYINVRDPTYLRLEFEIVRGEDIFNFDHEPYIDYDDDDDEDAIYIDEEDEDDIILTISNEFEIEETYNRFGGTSTN